MPSNSTLDVGQKLKSVRPKSVGLPASEPIALINLVQALAGQFAMDFVGDTSALTATPGGRPDTPP